MIGVVATACSEGTRPPEARARTQTPPAPAATTYTAPAREAPAPVVAGPASFADGEAAYHAGNYVEAAQVFARYTGERPENAWGHYMLGLSAWKSGDPAGAEQAFGSSLRLDPNHVKSLVNLSRVLLDGNRAGDALETLTRARDLDPSSNVVHRLLGRAYGLQGDFDRAVDAYQRALAIDDQDSWSMNNLGLLFLEHDLAADALPLLARAVELRQDVPAFHNNLGMALEHAGRFKDAAAAYGTALAASPGYDKAQRNMTRVELVKEDPQEPADPDTAGSQVIEDAGISGTNAP
jgi:superkiller protein 3